MKIFLDTANVDEIRRAAELGLVDGVTTNPSLIAKEGKAFKERIQEICSIVPGDVSAETVSTDWEGMVREGRELATWAPNVVVKCPCTPDGLRATKTLSDQAIKVNVTLIFSVTQGLLACKNGAYIISPFLGRLDDIGLDGMELVRDLVVVKENYSFPAQVLAASIRTPNHVIEAAKASADIATMPAAVFNMLYKHPLTDIGMTRFLADWKTLPNYAEAIFPRAAATAAAGD
ncbi:MAG TPA: fructose-6-phosphate aldolase [Chloroflexota bacterium]|jgi:transaldolase|nr:fructose-6-phosphate aldolase [Chloroflexota bacterium]